MRRLFAVRRPFRGAPSLSAPISRVPIVCTIVLAVVTTASCAPQDEGPEKLDNYLSRLGRAVEVKIQPPPFIAPPRINDAELKPIELAPSKIGVLEFLSLSGCDLQVNLGRRNSSLGRHASPSQRLLLDLEFLELAPACIGFLESKGESALAQDIQQIVATRRAALPATIYNAIFTGPEFRAFWHLPPSLGTYPQNTSGDVVDALNWLNQNVQRWLSGDYRERTEPDSDEAPNTSPSIQFGNGALEQRLSTLRAGDGGALMLAVAEQARALAQASEALTIRTQERTLCPGGNETSTSKIVRTVVVKFFAGDVQTWLASLNSRQSALMDPLRALETQLDVVLPVDYRQWQAERDQLLSTLQSSPKDHVSAIKSALNDCPSLPWG